MKRNRMVVAAVTQVGYTAADKPGKDSNFRGLTIFNNTMYVTKGSGGNGINAVYQVGNAGVLPTPTDVKTAPITVLPGFPTTLASGVAQDGTAGHPVMFPRCMSAMKVTADWSRHGSSMAKPMWRTIPNWPPRGCKNGHCRTGPGTSCTRCRMA